MIGSTPFAATPYAWADEYGDDVDPVRGIMFDCVDSVIVGVAFTCSGDPATGTEFNCSSTPITGSEL